MEEVGQSLPSNSSTSDEALHVGTADKIMDRGRARRPHVYPAGFCNTIW